MIEDREKKQMSKTDENYLKTILILQRRHGVATAADLGKVFSAGISTVYNAINKLERDGYISSIKGTRSKKPAIELTEKGKEIADNTFARHQKIQNWLMLLGSPEEIAESEACMLEHGLSENTMKIIAKNVEMAKENFGEKASYPQKMKQMAYAMERMHQNKTGMTEMDKMEDAIMAVIHDLAKTKTVLLISHRLANVVNADQILLLKNGKITEVGTHATLLGKQGDYAKLYLEQQALESYGKEAEPCEIVAVSPLYAV